MTLSLSFTFQDSQPPWRSGVNVSFLDLRPCILLVYIVRHCMEESVLRDSPAVRMRQGWLDVRRKVHSGDFRRLNSRVCEWQEMVNERDG